MELESTIIMQRWSCYNCHIHFTLDAAEEEPKCPQCGDTHIFKRCDADPEGGCKCPTEVHSGIKYCPKCGKPVCPGCGDHDVTQISRVTGYLSDVSGWNAAKRQELLDRTRTPVEKGEVIT